ncbi:hypothetical protein U9M48_004556 [Paspalum notatum var. saurae]|uniref:Uncharacterized protein n=1 Tax=Paspalum notatum var. saurae TaxID=547442 RepID=A0AAQ3PN83_PASNO
MVATLPTARRPPLPTAEASSTHGSAANLPHGAAASSSHGAAGGRDHHPRATARRRPPSHAHALEQGRPAAAVGDWACVLCAAACASNCATGLPPDGRRRPAPLPVYPRASPVSAPPPETDDVLIWLRNNSNFAIASYLILIRGETEFIGSSNATILEKKAAPCCDSIASHSKTSSHPVEEAPCPVVFNIYNMSLNASLRDVGNKSDVTSTKQPVTWIKKNVTGIYYL